MSGGRKLVLVRLEKEERKLREDPLEQAWVAREGVLNFHFCLHGLSAPYEGGYYHGVIRLSEDYPFSPPTLSFFTPSGRFETNKNICTTFTNFHRETWSSAWSVRSMILATISFMMEEAKGSVGSLTQTTIERRHHAENSMRHNLTNHQFRELFHR